MKLWSIIGASLAAALALAAGAGEMALVETQLNPAVEKALGFALAAAGGPGGLCLILFAVLSAVLIAESAVVDLGRVRDRLPQGAVRRLPEAWAEALTGTAFAGLAASIAGEDLVIPPFALTRIVRAEVWRIVARRLVTAQMVTVALAALALVLAPELPATPSVATDIALRIDVFAAAAFFASAVTGWLLIERAIDALALVLTQRLAAAEATVRPAGLPASRPAGADPMPMAIEPLAAAVHRLAGLIERLGERESMIGSALEQSAAAQRETFSTALDRAGERDERMLEPIGAALAQLTAALEQSAVAQRETFSTALDRAGERDERMLEPIGAALAQLTSTLEQSAAAQRADFSAALDRAGERDARMLEPIGTALAELAAALERVAETDADHMKRVGAVDRHLLAFLRRQEEIVESLSQRWSELTQALEALTAGGRTPGKAAALSAVVGAAKGASETGEELQELLELLDEGPGSDTLPQERGRLTG